MRMDLIEKLAHTPRPVDDTLLKVRGRPFFFLRKANREWEAEMTTSPLVFAYVVQANEVLFEPGAGETAPAVLLYTRDARYSRDRAWLAQLAERIFALKTSGTNDPAANKLGAYLAAETSDFDMVVPTSLTDGVEARVFTTYVSGYKLPNMCIGPDRVIPGLALPDDFAIIPGELYT
jgi:hypothetical protein